MDGHAHALVMFVVQHDIAVSCTCQLAPPAPGRHRRSYRPLEIRSRWTTAEVLECFTAWHPDGGKTPPGYD